MSLAALLAFTMSSGFASGSLLISFIRWIDPALFQGDGFEYTAKVSLIVSYFLLVLGCVLALVS